jgi:hypothetical protein
MRCKLNMRLLACLALAGALATTPNAAEARGGQFVQGAINQYMNGGYGAYGGAYGGYGRGYGNYGGYGYQSNYYRGYPAYNNYGYGARVYSGYGAGYPLYGYNNAYGNYGGYPRYGGAW